MRKSGILTAGVVALFAIASTSNVASADSGTLLSPVPAQNAGQDGRAYDVAIRNGVAYVGGTFANTVDYNGANPQSHPNLAAYNIATGAVINTFTPNVNGLVYTVVADSTGVYIGGDFTAVNGVKAVRIAKLDLAGHLVPGFKATANRSVRGLAVVGSKLYLAGFFTKVDGASKSFMAAVDTTAGTLDSSFNPNPDAKAFAVEALNGRVFFGGKFLTLGGNSHPRLTEVNPSTGAGIGPVFEKLNGIVLNIAFSPTIDQVFAAVDSGQNSALAWNAAGKQQWAQKADGDVQAIEWVKGNVYFGFHDGFNKNNTLRLLAADATLGSPTNGTLEAFAPPSGGLKGVLGLDTDGSKLVAVGDFNQMGGRADKGVAVFG